MKVSVYEGSWVTVISLLKIFKILTPEMYIVRRNCIKSAATYSRFFSCEDNPSAVYLK